MEDYVLLKLQYYIKETYQGPVTVRFNWTNRATFVQASYQKWAAKEFMDYITNRDADEDLYFSAEKFAKMMNKFSLTKRNSWMFSIAYDVAMDLLDVMQSYINKEVMV